MANHDTAVRLSRVASLLAPYPQSTNHRLTPLNLPPTLSPSNEHHGIQQENDSGSDTEPPRSGAEGSKDEQRGRRRRRRSNEHSTILRYISTALQDENATLRRAITLLESGTLTSSDQDPSTKATASFPYTLNRKPLLTVPELPSPFETTRQALLRDLDRVRHLIAQKDLEIKEICDRGIRAISTIPTNRIQLGRDLDRAEMRISTYRRRIPVLRDTLIRYQQLHSSHLTRSQRLKNELRVMIRTDDAETKEKNEYRVRTALVEVEDYIDILLKDYNDNETIPKIFFPIPIASIAPPPSAVHKDKGRPLKSQRRTIEFPPQLAYLLPGKEEVKAISEKLPTRNRGQKRSMDDEVMGSTAGGEKRLCIGGRDMSGP